jgi:hypothetical protein
MPVLALLKGEVYLAAVRKTITFLILLSMVAHSAARLGVLSYLYENRLSIGHTLGLVTEIPIALCSHDYDFGGALVITENDAETGIPANYFQAREIILFYESSDVELTASLYPLGNKSRTALRSTTYSSPEFSFFHPPTVG